MDCPVMSQDSYVSIYMYHIHMHTCIYICLVLLLLAFLEQGHVQYQMAKDSGPEKPTHSASSTQNMVSFYMHAEPSNKRKRNRIGIKT